jgi:ferredoxin-NADP reductase
LPTPIKVAAKISEIIEHASDLRSFILTPERRIPAFVPGQFLHLAIDPYEPGSHWPESRVYSIASSPVERQHLRITISRQGVFTGRMFDELKVGSKVWVKLPYGTFCPNADVPGRMVMLAGGSGITPFVSFLEWAVAAQPAAAIDLHYGARTADLLIYRSTIEKCQLAGLHDLRARYYVEEAPHNVELDPALVVGRLSPERVWQELAEPRSCRFYLSGPRAMIDAFRSQLVGLGAAAESVLSDDWS